MRMMLIGGCILGALVVSACQESSSGGNAAPAASAAPAKSAAPATSAAAAGSASPKADKEKTEGAENDTAGKKEVGPKDHKALIKAFEEAWGSHDPKKVAALYAKDAVVHQPGSPEGKGREAIEKSAASMMGAFKELAFVPGRAWAKDKKTLVVEWLTKGTNTGDIPDLGIKASNKPIGITSASWLTLNDEGLIKEERTYWDTMTLIGQAGEKAEKDKKKEAVRPVLTAVPDGDKHYEASTRREEKEAKDEKDKAEIATMVKVEKEELELERRAVAALNDGKPEELYKLIAKDYRYADYTEEKDAKGEKEFKDLLQGWLKAIPDMKQKSTAAFADAEFAVEEFEYTGTHKGPIGATKATNKPVTLHQLEIDEFKEGKFVKSWVWWNKAELLSEIGAMPAPSPSPTPSSAPSGKPKP